MRTDFDEMVENQMIGLSMLSEDTKYSLERLEESCKELREMMQSKNPAKDDLFAGLPRVKASIIIEAMLLVESDDWRRLKDELQKQG